MADMPDGWSDGLRRVHPHASRTTLDEVRHACSPGTRIWVGRTPGRRRDARRRRRSTTRSPGPMLRAQRRRLRRPQGLPVPRLRDLRLRRARSASTATSTIATWCAWRRCGSRSGSWSRRSTGCRLEGAPINVDDPARHPAAQVAGDERHGGDDPPLQAGDGRRRGRRSARRTWRVESPKGEMGYYLVSDGTSKPVRWRIRPPSFINLSALPEDGAKGACCPTSSRSTPASTSSWERSTDERRSSGDAHGRTARARRAVRAGVRRRGAGHELDAAASRKYPTKQACLLPALWMVQEERGWISEPAMAEVAEVLGADAGVREGRGDVLHHVPPRTRSGGTSSRCAPRRRATSAARRTW